jgi:hypothetical protein
LKMTPFLHHAKSRCLLGLTAALLLAVPATAGNIFLTGHDDDFHQSVNADAQMTGAISFVRAGSGLKVLTFDAGTELTGLLTTLGIAFDNVNPNTASNVTDALFNHSVYSAFLVASDSSCGGCDNSAAGEANIAAHAAAIASFLNGGGGILGLAGASSAGYYTFVPQTATSVGGAPSSGYTATALGTSLGIPAVNGDATHNLFFNPGTSGESSAYQIVELNTASGNGTILPPAAVSLVCVNCTTSGGVITGGGGGGTPEPGTWVLVVSATAALGFFRRRRFSGKLL